MNKKRPDFNSRAAEWDNLPRRVLLANAVADLIIKEVHPEPWMRMLDYGCGTGLVTLGLQQVVKEVIAADSSIGMLEQLQTKAEEAQIANIHTLLIDLDQKLKLPQGIDLLVSSMTMHHVPDLDELFSIFRLVMNPDGWLCIADLETEDGSFHDDQSVHIPHPGFNIDEMELYFKNAGFRDVKTLPVMTIKKERDGSHCGYPVNLTFGRS